MPLSAKSVRKQLMILKPLLSGLSLKTYRNGQNKLGELMESRYRSQVLRKEHAFECGFSSQSYFSYVFKRRMHQTPREYVKRLNDRYEKNNPIS